MCGLVTGPGGKAEPVPLKDLVQFRGIYLQCAVIAHVERHGVRTIGSSWLQEQLARLPVAEELLIFKSAPVLSKNSNEGNALQSRG